MSYKEAIEFAGATVKAFESFGSYQGDWIAKVDFKGKIGWIQGSYGSCSGCDAFEAEFGYKDKADSGYNDKLCNFGLLYLDNIVTQKQIEAFAAANISWDRIAAEEM